VYEQPAVVPLDQYYVVVEGFKGAVGGQATPFHAVWTSNGAANDVLGAGGALRPVTARVGAPQSE
jgi:hypothetical protein